MARKGGVVSFLTLWSLGTIHYEGRKWVRIAICAPRKVVRKTHQCTNLEHYWCRRGKGGTCKIQHKQQKNVCSSRDFLKKA